MGKTEYQPGNNQYHILHLSLDDPKRDKNVHYKNIDIYVLFNYKTTAVIDTLFKNYHKVKVSLLLSFTFLVSLIKGYFICIHIPVKYIVSLSWPI